MKRLVLIGFILFYSLLFIHGEEELYQVIDLSDDSLIETFDTYHDAFESMSAIEDAGIMYQNQLIAMNEGVVILKHDNCLINIDTINQKTDEKGYVNGCYGNDALYLKTNSTGKWVLMLQSGVRSWVSIDDVTLVPYDSDLKLSSYFVKDGNLYHQIRTRWNQNEIGSLINLGCIDLPFQENVEYFSYDGHLFYTDFKLMSTDMKQEKNSHAVNAGNPYYQYFMYLPHRSMSSYDADDFQAYFDSMGMNHPLYYYEDQNKDSINDMITTSQYSGALDSFVYTQAEYGANALLMLSLSMNESATGRSSLAYRRNNLFGHSAFDSDVESHAKRYASIENSVISHARNYISSSYANPDKFMYHGSFFGNKNSGMNVAYASDPYWSEKAASYAYELDQSLGGKDYNRYALAIVNDESHINLLDKTYHHIICSIEDISCMSFVIVSETNDFYEVQLDDNRYLLNDQPGSYDFLKNTAYLSKNLVDYVINEDAIDDIEIIQIEFDAGDGVFKDGASQKILQFETGKEPVCEVPILDQAVFDSWEKTGDFSYRAIYRTVKSIQMHTLPEQVTELNVPLDLRGGSVAVEYEDGTFEIFELTTSMISNFSLSQVGEQSVTVTLGGVSTSYPIRVSLEFDELRNQMMGMINLLSDDNITQEEKRAIAFELKQLMHKEFFPVLTMNEITVIDEYLKSMCSDEYSVIIKKNPVHLALTGFYLPTDIETDSLFNPTIKFSYQSANIDRRWIELLQAQGWTYEDGFEISMSVNERTESWDGPMLFSIDRQDKNLKNWSVFYIEGDDLVECHTAIYADRIRFKAMKPGVFLLASKESVNAYDSAAPKDTLTYKDNGTDVILIVKLILIVFLCTGCVLLLSKRKK